MLEELKEQVCSANLSLVSHGLVTLTWGNVSAIDGATRLVVIKPSGVPYSEMTPATMVVVDLDGNTVEGDLRPSSDTPSHVTLYRALDGIGAITHTHSTHATMFAQAKHEIPCFGTTHADHFYGTVPVTRGMTEAEVRSAYEANTGAVIVERFAELDPHHMPAVLVANHGPFTWGKDTDDAVKNAVALEETARMAMGTLELNPNAPPISSFLLDKHYLRKHGTAAYYGQK